LSSCGVVDFKFTIEACRITIFYSLIKRELRDATKQVLVLKHLHRDSATIGRARIYSFPERSTGNNDSIDNHSFNTLQGNTTMERFVSSTR